MKPIHSPHPVPAPTTGLRLSALGRRISASGSVALVLSDLVYGARERDHVEVLHHTTRARCAEAGGVSR